MAIILAVTIQGLTCSTQLQGVIEWIVEVHVGTGRYDETRTYLFHTVAKTHHVD